LKKDDKNNPYLVINKDKVFQYFKENISSILDIPPEPPKFDIKEGKINNFTPGKDGSEIDIDQAVKDLDQFLSSNKNYFEIKMKKASPKTEIGNNNKDFAGIKEVIGEYSLSFAGSSSSRIKNITNGASKINGVIIKPGEEFSTLKFIAPVETSNGYAKEAVINGGAINYEVGGGLCQLSTTLFRTVLNTGLPVTMRKNHTYDMSYYLPVGVDAAIYDPSPDFKFLNDTGNNILIITWTENMKLNIQIWGTNDGRIIKRTEPVRYNIVRAKSAKIIKTRTLAKGVTKCSYGAYTGSDTYFDYIVTYADGTVKEERFNSHYIPRQGLCYVGI
jgi:vancomycin resistance protein YoaR